MTAGGHGWVVLWSCLPSLLAQVNKAFSFIAKHGHKTKVMASNIRTREDVKGLLGEGPPQSPACLPLARLPLSCLPLVRLPLRRRPLPGADSVGVI